VVVTVSREPATLSLPADGGLTARQLDERYRLDRDADGAVRLTVATDLGFHLGLNAIRRGLEHDEWSAGGTEYPKFSTRGVLEGFYGPPWSHAERLDMVDFLADHDFNLFVLAPKDEASQRWDWRSELSEADQRNIRSIVDRARAQGVEIMCCVSPGLSIRYSDEADRRALVARMLGFHSLGVKRVGLLLDDIPGDLQFDGDRAAYTSIAHAHGELASYLANQLWSVDADIELAVCPLVYHGIGDEPYVIELGRWLHPRIDMFWTGREICSHRLDLADAATLMRSTRRPPLYWDNYPVNDVAMVGELHIGPYRGRDRHLYRFSTGIALNASDRAETSKISFATAGDYLRDPESYDPEKSWHAAIADLAGADAPAYTHFAENAQWSCLATVESPALGGVIEQAWLHFGAGDKAAGCSALLSFADEIDRTCSTLLGSAPVNARLVEQSRPWIEQYGRGAAALRQVAALVSGGLSQEVARTALRPMTHQAAFADHPRVFGDTMSMFIDDVLAQNWAAQ
jgi:hyaluronoglucosaminidase